MRAILLAAGFGTRLRPLTDRIPKCLVPINGTPLLGIWLENLFQAGIERVLINTHYLADQVIEYISGSQYVDRVELVYEETLCGTAGTLMNNAGFLGGEDGLLIHSDNYCLSDLGKLIAAHQQRPPECMMTMLTFKSENPSSCGIVELDDRGVMVNICEKCDDPPGNLANAAVYVISNQLILYIDEQLKNATDFSVDVLNHLSGYVYTHPVDDVLIDVGTVQRYEKANNIAKSLSCCNAEM